MKSIHWFYILTLLTVLSSSAVDAKPGRNLPFLQNGDIAANRCSLPPLNSTTVGSKLIDVFSQIQLGWTPKQVQSLVTLEPERPGLVKMLGSPHYVLNYQVPLSDNLKIFPHVAFDGNKKVEFVNIELAQNVMLPNQKNCNWQLLPHKK